MGRLMSDAEIRRRKKLQGHISQTTGALGLTALGGTMLATKSGSKLTRRAFEAAGRERPAVLKPKNLRRKTAPILATSAGIGGAGSFNFASYTNAEGRKRGPQKVKKSYEDAMPVFGEIAKAWDPAPKKYDPEKKRDRRSKVTQNALAGTAAGTGVVAAGKGAEAVGRGVEARRMFKLHAITDKKSPWYHARGAQAAGLHVKSVKAGKTAAALGAVSAGTGAAAAGVKNRRKKSWQSYGLRRQDSETDSRG